MNAQLRAAQRQYDNQCDDHLLPTPDDEARDEEIESLAAAYAQNEGMRNKAAVWLGGELDGEHYEEVDLALFDLHGMDAADLLDSDLLTKLYERAAVVHAVYAKWFRDQAGEEIDRQHARRHAA